VQPAVVTPTTKTTERIIMTTLTNTMTTESQYDDQLAVITNCAHKIVDITIADGNMRNWLNDAINNSWVSGITLQMWLTRALSMCAGYDGDMIHNIDKLHAL
jgi:hypothetical protein